MSQFRHVLKFWTIALAGLLLNACGGGSEYDGFDASVNLSDPDAFLRFFNQQADLGAGNYTLVVAVAGVAGQTGTFTVTISRNDGGATQIFNGSWASTAMIAGSPPVPSPETTCADEPDPGNRCYTLDLQDASGASFDLTTDPGVDGILYLVDTRGTAQVVGTANANGAGVAERLVFSDAAIDESDFASAYYAAIDPNNARTTAQDFRSLHGFDTPGADVHVIFRDSKDLGYGRDMYLRSYADPCGHVIAFFVRNFSVEVVEGFAYGPVNLEAAIVEDLDHHIGSNAIEFSSGVMAADGACSAEPMAKFYTFDPVYNPLGAPHPRRDRVDLDARGMKAMPQPCISCHGGKLRPLDRDGAFVAMHAEDPANQIGDTKARMQAFEVDTFDFSDQAPYRRVDQEDLLRQMNEAIYCTYPGSAGHPSCAAHGGGLAAQGNLGEWSGDFAREVLLGWYGDDGVNDALNDPNSVFDASFVPAGWVPSVGGPPVGADTLWTKVVGPNCFVCHGKQGGELGTNSSSPNIDASDGKDIDFGSWDKFISHADEIEALVYDEGRMPLGLLNFQNFWGDPEKAELLASFIQPFVTDPAGFDARRLSGGKIIEPGERVVARAGPDRITQLNWAITLNAEASLFADAYTWQVTSMPAGAVATLSNPTAMRTDFSGNLAGTYTIQMTASGSGSSRSDSLTVEVVNAGLTTAPRDLTFYTDITAELVNCAAGCHENSGVAGAPVWWTEAQPFPVPPAGTAQLSFYEQVMARVRLDHIEDSLILKKPSGFHHYGDQRAGFDTSLAVGSAGRAAYDMFVNWIAEGAPCGGTADQCVR